MKRLPDMGGDGPELEYPEILVLDMNDQEIKVGTRVKYFDSEDEGVITAISDIDGDVDDETGRSILVPPQITVKWDTSGTEKYWSRYQGGSYYDGKMKFEVEDVDVILKATVTRRASGYGFRCTCGEAPNRSTKQRSIAERWAKNHEASHND